jgi:hypothetical protein
VAFPREKTEETDHGFHVATPLRDSPLYDPEVKVQREKNISVILLSIIETTL